MFVLKAIVYWKCKSDLKGEIVCFKCEPTIGWIEKIVVIISTVVLADRRSGTVNVVFIRALLLHT